MSTDPYVAAAQLVDAIRALPALDRAALERLLGVPLHRSPGVAADDEDYETPLPNGPFSTVEVRTSNPRQQKFALVVLTVREGTVLTLSGLRATGRIREDMAIRPNVRVPPEGRMDFVDKTKDQEVDYSFWIKRQELVEVTIARPPSS